MEGKRYAVQELHGLPQPALWWYRREGRCKMAEISYKDGWLSSRNCSDHTVIVGRGALSGLGYLSNQEARGEGPAVGRWLPLPGCWMMSTGADDNDIRAREFNREGLELPLLARPRHFLSHPYL